MANKEPWQTWNFSHCQNIGEIQSFGVTPLESQMIVSIATILCSGVISAFVTHKLSAGRAEKDFRRKKLEELYFAVHSYCNKLFSANMAWPQVMRGEISYDDANELIIKNHDKGDKSHDIAQMLINIYCHQLGPRSSRLQSVGANSSRCNAR